MNFSIYLAIGVVSYALCPYLFLLFQAYYNTHHMWTRILTVGVYSSCLLDERTDGHLFHAP